MLNSRKALTLKITTGILKKGLMFVKKNGRVLLLLGLLVCLSLVWSVPPQGLNVNFYSNTKRKGVPQLSQRVTQVNLEPIERDQSFPQRNFSASWVGWIRIDRNGEYSFATKSDDGSSLFIDKQEVVENGGFHGNRKVSSKIFLTRGMHVIRIVYFQGKGNYDLQVSWTQPGKIETELPPHILYAQPFPIRGSEFLSRIKGSGFLSRIKGSEFFSRHFSIFYPLCWLLLIAMLLKRWIDGKAGNVARSLKKYACNTAVSIAAVFVCFLLIEGGMRLFLWFGEKKQELSSFQQSPPPNDGTQIPQKYAALGNIVQASPYEGIVYELKPHLAGTFLGASLRTNAEGLRILENGSGKEDGYSKPDNTFRIIGLGDSSMFGWNVNMAETSLHVLENRLNQDVSDTNYEAINLGVPGYNTAIEVEVFLKKGLKYNPDLVILHFNTNDYSLPNFMKLPQSFSTLRKSYLLDFIYARYQLLRGKPEEKTLASPVLGPVEKSEYLDESPTIPRKYRYMVGKRGFLKAMDMLIAATEERSIPLLVFVIKSTSDVETFRGRQLQLIEQLSRERHFSLLNTYSYYAEYLNAHPEHSVQDFHVSERDTHPSVLSHKIEAQALYDFLIERKLVPRTQSKTD